MPAPKPKVNIATTAEETKRKAAALGEGLMRRLIGLTRYWGKRRDIIANNYNLGMRCLKDGHIRDAILRFKIVTWMEPQRADAWYYLGCSYLANNERSEAQKALARTLQMKPDYEEANYALALAGAVMTPDRMPKRMPLPLVLSHFEARAAGYTSEQIETYHYQGHVLLADAIQKALVQGRIDHTVLELGVGTGLLGMLLKPIASHITGVDLSGAMLAEAVSLTDEQGKKIYDALIKREVHEFLAEVAEAAFDIVAAADVVSYIGELDGLFTQVARVMKPGALFAFTADRADNEGFQLDITAGKFSFSRPYLEGLARANGLRIILCEEAPVYPDYKAWICVFAK